MKENNPHLLGTEKAGKLPVAFCTWVGAERHLGQYARVGSFSVYYRLPDAGTPY